MLFTKSFREGKKLYRRKPTLIKAKDGYVKPSISFDTTTTIWHTDELIKRRVRDWMRLIGEDGYSGIRESVARKELTIYTGTYSVFPIPLMEWILVRYGGDNGGIVLDAFAGGPPRGIVSGIMGFEYHGHDINKKQIEHNRDTIKDLGISNVHYHLRDARNIDKNKKRKYDIAITCPPYYNVEVYSDAPNDLSNLDTYENFNEQMKTVALAHKPLMKPEAFICIVVANFRDKKTGELIDFRGHTVENFKNAGFLFWQDIILSKNFGSAAKRGANAWRGMKLVPRHEHLLVFRTPAIENKKSKRKKRLDNGKD